MAKIDEKKFKKTFRDERHASYSRKKLKQRLEKIKANPDKFIEMVRNA